MAKLTRNDKVKTGRVQPRRMVHAERLFRTNTPYDGTGDSRCWYYGGKSSGDVYSCTGGSYMAGCVQVRTT